MTPTSRTQQYANDVEINSKQTKSRMNSDEPNVLAVIPARFQSKRFPGKPLAIIAGKPMIQRVYETTSATRVSKTLVATDDQRIFDCVTRFGGEVVLTSSSHATGTDRVAEVAKSIDADLVLNVQGDEPLISATVIDDLIDAMLSEDNEAEMGTIAVPLAPESFEFRDPNVVKVVLDNAGYALYFSRSSIPFCREIEGDNTPPYQHWGIYAFKPKFLQDFVRWPRGGLERAENLEQLRALENGVKISVVISSHGTVGVDVPDDIRKVEARLKERDS